MSLDLHRALVDSRRNPVVVDRGYDCALIHARETDEWGVGHSLDRSWSYEHDGATWGLTEDEARAEYLDERNLRYCPEHRVYFADNEYTRCGQCPDPLAPPVVEVATAERKPCGAWSTRDELDIGVVIAEAFYVGGRGGGWSWCLKAGRTIVAHMPSEIDPHPSRAAAQLAAEDAARALLLDGLAVLAPGMPKGWSLTAHVDALPDGGPLYVLHGATCWAELGDAADVDAVALGMLAAVRK